MKPAVALAMLEREGRWLLQLRDDIDSIISVSYTHLTLPTNSRV